MSESIPSIDEFRAMAVEHFRFLQAEGFQRRPDLEYTSTTVGTVVFCGKHVAFIFSIDVRDKCVDARVASVENRVIKGEAEGGYSSDLFTYLVKRGYRGRPPGARTRSNTPRASGPIEYMVEAWADILKAGGKALLSDTAGSIGTWQSGA